MSATVEIDEANGVGETLSHGVANSNMGNSDSKEIVALTYPIAAGENSYEKFQKLHVTDMGGSSKIDNIRVWREGALGGAAVHLANVKTTEYAGAPTYHQPVATDSSLAVNAVPTSEPASANLGIGGALDGALTAAGSSDYLCHQIQTDPSDTAGSSSTLHIAFDEVA